jgi:hypothetical protein
MKLPRRHDRHAQEKARLAAEFGVDRVFYADEPFWYTRLSCRFRLTWRRELATVGGVFVLGIALGLALGHI